TPTQATEAKFKRFEQVNGDFGWTPHKLDPKECAQLAYEAYWYKGYACGYGVFYGIVGSMAEKYGAPYNQFPFTMFEFLKGGISDWGTICGALGAAAAAFALFYGRKDRNAMVSDLYRWYEQTSLPIYNPGDAAKGVKGEIPQSVSEAVICHISVSKWCFTNFEEATSKKRSERCGRLTADVCAKAVEILNAKMELGDKYVAMFGKQDSVKQCGECHHAKGNDANWGKGILNCTPCHDGRPPLNNKFKDHP
ncbi:MAG: C-GCAxxG-C-C family protein, partial [Desulfovibrionaceae bacterium]|nr:C-GCAxxG-C-C family protein [Desulfovibrionaceae bacterium]